MSAIRPVSTGDLRAVARVHIAAFPESALSSLGPSVVEAYYAFRFDVAVGLVALGAWEEDELIGFVVAGSFSRGLREFFRRCWSKILLATARRPWVLLRRRFWEASETAAGAMTRSRGSDSGLLPPDSVGIMAVGVVPTLRRSGVASALMAEAEQRLSSSGVVHLHLSVRADNPGALRFYEARGWRQAQGRGATVLMRKVL